MCSVLYQLTIEECLETLLNEQKNIRFWDHIGSDLMSENAFNKHIFFHIAQISLLNESAR